MSTKSREHTLVGRDPEVMGGIAVFGGTRVPVETLVDCIEQGYTLDEFLEDFPSVRREQVQAALDLLRQALLSA